MIFELFLNPAALTHKSRFNQKLLYSYSSAIIFSKALIAEAIALNTIPTFAS